MTYLLTVVFCTASLLFCVYIYQKWNSYNAFRLAAIQYGCQRPPRYPHRDPIWGYDIFRQRATAVQSGKLMKLYVQHFELYGKTFEEQFFNEKVINTMEVANIQQVGATSFQDWGVGPLRQGSFSSSPFIERGVFSHDGAVWKHHRDLIKPTFSRSEISNLDSLSVYMDRLLTLIPRDGSTIDLQPLLHRLFLDVSTDFLFGEPMNALLPEPPLETTQFIKAWTESQAGVGRRRRAGKLRFLYMFDKTWKEAYQEVHAFVDLHVARTLNETAAATQTSSSEKLPSDQESPSNRYVLLHELAKEVRDPIDLRYQVLNVFSPARDTVSILVGNALFHLARNPDIWTELRTAALSLGSQPLTFELLKSLTLFRYVLFETFRLQGPSGRVLRTALRSTILPRGGGPSGQSPVFVEKGVVVSLNLWCLNHDRDIWGEDVDIFRPQRWVGRRPMWEFVPFFGGPRICPAQQQVMTQAVYFLVRLVQEFARIENRDSVQEYVELTKMTTESRNGVKIALFPESNKKTWGK